MCKKDYSTPRVRLLFFQDADVIATSDPVTPFSDETQIEETNAWEYAM